MLKFLSGDAAEQYQHDGFHFPIRVLSPAGPSEYRDRLETAEREQGGPLRGALRHKSHILFTRLDALGHHPITFDAVLYQDASVERVR